MSALMLLETGGLLAGPGVGTPRLSDAGPISGAGSWGIDIRRRRPARGVFSVAERDPQPARKEIQNRHLRDRDDGRRHREAMAMAIAATVRAMAGRVMACVFGGAHCR